MQVQHWGLSAAQLSRANNKSGQVIRSEACSQTNLESRSTACNRQPLQDAAFVTACKSQHLWRCSADLLRSGDSWPPTRYKMLTASHKSLCSAVTDAGLSGLQRRSQAVSRVAWERAAWLPNMGQPSAPCPSTVTVSVWPCPSIPVLSLYLSALSRALSPYKQHVTKCHAVIPPMIPHQLQLIGRHLPKAIQALWPVTQQPHC